MGTTAARYLLWWIGTALLVILAVAGINLVTDPYGVYRLVDLPGVNDFKSRAQQRGLLFKLHLLERSRPTAIILGNSRAEVGFDPHHPGFKGSGGTVVNLALPGTGIETTVRFFRHAVASGRPKLAVVGLDFIDARTDGDPQRATQRYQALPAALDRPLQSRWEAATSHVDSLLSVDALYDSVATLLHNRTGDSAGLTNTGFNPMRDYTAIAAREGYYSLFHQRDLENARNYAQGPREVFVRGSRSSPYFEAVRSLLKSARAAGVELHLAIYPYHAHILELFDRLGLWPAFEQWKEALVELVHEESAGIPGGSIRLWDFSGYHEYATEPVPPAGDRGTIVHWYWEAGHFKKELGDVLLDEMLGSARRAESGSGMGTLLEPATLPRHLSRIRAARADYRALRPAPARAMEQLAAAVRQH